jgi:hypothetical protein
VPGFVVASADPSFVSAGLACSASGVALACAGEGCGFGVGFGFGFGVAGFAVATGFGVAGFGFAVLASRASAWLVLEFQAAALLSGP